LRRPGIAVLEPPEGEVPSYANSLHARALRFALRHLDTDWRFVAKLSPPTLIDALAYLAQLGATHARGISRRPVR
jgi:hypothetical protein